jgi:hypothetical protein
MLAATPRWATLPTSRPFHRGLYRRICASIDLRLWTSLATLPARHTLWSTRLEFTALRISSRSSPPAPVSCDCRCQQGVGCVVGSLRRSAGFRGFSPAAGLPGVLRCIGVWFWWLYYIPSVGSSVHNISGTRECSLHVGFDFCHSGNAIRRCARAWNINTWAFSFTGDTSRSQRSRRPHRGCLAHARSLSSCVAKARSLAGCVARSRSRASNGVYATYAGLRWNGIFFS